jgi:hypothetical protein
MNCDDAAPQAAEGMTATDIEQSLTALRMVWGDEYLLGHDPEKGFWATPHGTPRLFTAYGPRELGEILTEDAGAPS